MFVVIFEILALQAKCKALVKKFNEMPTEAMAEREALLHDIFGEVGKNVWLNSPLSATIGPNVTLCTIGHPIHPAHRMDGMYSFPITIGDNVWIGGNVMVLPGVTIGENSVIGAGSVVTRDIPANVVAFGAPCMISVFFQ